LFDEADETADSSVYSACSVFTFSKDPHSCENDPVFFSFERALRQAFHNINARSDPKMRHSRVSVRAHFEGGLCSISVTCDGGPAVAGMIERKLYETPGIVSVTRNISKISSDDLLVAYYEAGSIWVARTFIDIEKKPSRVPKAKLGAPAVPKRSRSKDAQLDFGF